MSRITAAYAKHGLLLVQEGVLASMVWEVQHALPNKTASISALRCLQLYLERLGCKFSDPAVVTSMAGNAFSVVQDRLSGMALQQSLLLVLDGWCMGNLAHKHVVWCHPLLKKQPA